MLDQSNFYYPTNVHDEVSLASLDFEPYEDSAIMFNFQNKSGAEDDLDATFNFPAPTRHSTDISCIKLEFDSLQGPYHNITPST